VITQSLAFTQMLSTSVFFTITSRNVEKCSYLENMKFSVFVVSGIRSTCLALSDVLRSSIDVCSYRFLKEVKFNIKVLTCH